MHLFVVCDPLVNPDNGDIDCSLGDDGEANVKDSCSFTCDDGFKLNGSALRECQSKHGEGTSWSGREARCEAGMCRYFCEASAVLDYHYNIVCLHRYRCR